MKSMSEQKFVWDEAKAQANVRKHGITFKLASTIFHDRLIAIVHDHRHDGPDDRWIAVGVAEGGALVIVACAFDEVNGDPHVRIISARKATSRERREYEGGNYTIREPEMTTAYNGKPEVEAEDDLDMAPEYDFSNAIRGKFANVRFPVFIDNSILGYFHERSIVTGVPGDELIREVLRRHVAAAGYMPPVFSERR